MGKVGLRWILVVASVWMVARFSGAPAQAYEPDGEFRKGAIVITPQIGGGASNNVEGDHQHAHVSFVNSTVRFGAIPWDPVSEGFWKGALEAGLEPWVQVYVTPSALSEGVKGVAFDLDPGISLAEVSESIPAANTRAGSGVNPPDLNCDASSFSIGPSTSGRSRAKRSRSIAKYERLR